MSLVENPDVMAAVDRSEGAPRFVIADVSTDDAWIATPETDAVELGARR